MIAEQRPQAFTNEVSLAPVVVPEHGRLRLTPLPETEELLVNGFPVPRQMNQNSTPFILERTASSLEVCVHDWVGKLHFTSSGGTINCHALSYPSKLAEDPQAAFEALGGLADDLPEFAAQLGYPTELVPATRDLRVRPLHLQDLEVIALRSWHLLKRWRQQPDVQGDSERLLVRGGHVPDRVDWSATLDHWGTGGFPDHVARMFPHRSAAFGLEPVRRLWEELRDAALSVPGGTDLRQKVDAVLQTLPATPVPDTRPTLIGRTAHELRDQLRSLRSRSSSTPTGASRMPDLYELWVQASVLRAVGATEGQFEQRQGLYTGTFRSKDVQVTLNPRLGFRGIGGGSQQLMPDLLLEFASGEAVVCDVKYRRLDRLNGAQQREVTQQMLAYMGLLHARTGVVLWPAPLSELHLESPLPGSRARLLRVRAHPSDPPEPLLHRLRELLIPGVT